MEEKRGFNWKKLAYWVGGAVLFLFAFTWTGEHVDDFLRWKDERAARAFDAALEADREKLKQMEMADTYGATTPEGTIELIIAALEKDDIELAAKYYYVLDQEKARASFEKQHSEKGSLDIAITFFKDLLRGTKGCNEKGDGCTFYYEYTTTEDQHVNLPNNPDPYLIPKGSKERESGDFSLNVYTGVWKAEER